MLEDTLGGGYSAPQRSTTTTTPAPSRCDKPGALSRSLLTQPHHTTTPPVGLDRFGSQSRGRNGFKTRRITPSPKGGRTPSPSFTRLRGTSDNSVNQHLPYREVAPRGHLTARALRPLEPFYIMGGNPSVTSRVRSRADSRSRFLLTVALGMITLTPAHRIHHRIRSSSFLWNSADMRSLSDDVIAFAATRSCGTARHSAGLC